MTFESVFEFIGIAATLINLLVGMCAGIGLIALGWIHAGEDKVTIRSIFWLLFWSALVIHSRLDYISDLIMRHQR